MVTDELYINEPQKVSSVFKNRNFNLVFFGALVSRLGDVMFNFAMGWYILGLTGSAVLGFMFTAIGMFTLTIFTIFGGIIADKFNKVKLMFSMDFLNGISMFVFFFGIYFAKPIHVFLGIPEITWILIVLYLTSFFLHFFSAIFNPASNALLPKVIEETQYQQGQSYFNILSNGINIFGLIIGPILYMLFGVLGIYLLNGTSFILSGISELFIKVKSESEKEAIDFKSFRSSMKSDFKDGLTYIKKEPGLINLMILALMINFFLNPIYAIFPAFLYNQILKTTAIQFSLTEISFAVAGIITALVLAMRKQPTKVYQYIKWGLVINSLFTLIILGAFYSVIGEIISPIFFMISFCTLMFLVGAAITIVNVPLNVTFMKKIDKDMFGRVTSIFGTIVSMANPISLILFSILVDTIHVLPSMVLAVIGSFTGIFYLVFSRNLKDI